MKAILKTALAHSIRPIWALMCGLAGLALMTTVFIKHYDLNQKLTTEQGFEGQNKRKMKEGDSELAAAAVLPDAVVVNGENTNTVNTDIFNYNPSAARMADTDVAADNATLGKTAESKE